MKFKRSVAVAVVAGTMLMGSGVAYAYVKIAGSGTSDAKVTTSQGFSMLVTPAGITGLTPGATASALPVTVKNTGPSKIQINTVALSLSSTCGGTITVTQPTVAATVLAANASATFNGATIAMADSDTVDQTDCLGSTITVTASVNGG